jgi:ppGpp synthetase/RelA/SpoT-type nucleotidyltranferase
MYLRIYSHLLLQIHLQNGRCAGYLSVEYVQMYPILQINLQQRVQINLQIRPN